MDCNNCLQIPHIVCVFWREWYSQGGKGSVLKVLGQILQECLGMGGSSMGNQAVVGKPNGPILRHLVVHGPGYQRHVTAAVGNWGGCTKLDALHWRPLGRSPHYEMQGVQVQHGTRHAVLKRCCGVRHGCHRVRRTVPASLIYPGESLNNARLRWV